MTSAFAQDSKLDGVYVGLEPICWTLKNGTKECYSDPARPKRKWYHLTYLKVQGDTVFADQSPINIYNKDTLYSSSDGAYYYYHGHIYQSDTAATIQMKLIFCDYCGIPEENSANAYLFPSTKNYIAKVTSKGIVINGYLFTKTNKKEHLLSEHPGPYLKIQ